MKDKRILVVILSAVLLLHVHGLTSLSAKTVLSDYIMSLIKGGQQECKGRTCGCTIECNAYESQCNGADDCGGLPCEVGSTCVVREFWPYGKECDPALVYCEHGSLCSKCNHHCECGGTGCSPSAEGCYFHTCFCD